MRPLGTSYEYSSPESSTTVISMAATDSTLASCTLRAPPLVATEAMRGDEAVEKGHVEHFVGLHRPIEVVEMFCLQQKSSGTCTDAEREERLTSL